MKRDYCRNDEDFYQSRCIRGNLNSASVCMKTRYKISAPYLIKKITWQFSDEVWLCTCTYSWHRLCDFFVCASNSSFAQQINLTKKNRVVGKSQFILLSNHEGVCLNVFSVSNEHLWMQFFGIFCFFGVFMVCLFQQRLSHFQRFNIVSKSSRVYNCQVCDLKQ